MARKKTHILRPNKRQTYPRHVIFYDNESFQKSDNQGNLTHYLHMGIAQYVDYGRKNVEDEIVYKSTNEFWDWVLSKTVNQRTLFLIAHNQDFDFRLVKGFTHLQQAGFHSHKLILEYPRCICTWSNQKKVKGKIVHDNSSAANNQRRYITCLDTLNWFKESLAQLGEKIGAKKLEMPEYNAPFEDWITYCRQDVVVLRIAFENYIDFLHKNNLGTFGPTIASQALNAFKTRFMRHEIEIHTSDRANAIERRAYFGGRTDCFYVGELPKAKYYKLDINSMYPYVMRDNHFPTKLVGTSLCEFPEYNDYYREKYLCIADVEIETCENAFPYRGENKLLFPVGKFETTLCTPELDLLDRLDCNYKIKRMAMYESAKIFESFIHELYALRQYFKQQSNEQYQYFTKILMNSLYGKFGQKNDHWEYLMNDLSGESGWFWDNDPQTGEDIQIKKVCGEVYKREGEQDGFDTFVGISAFVTSYARRLLWDLYEQAGKENCFYTDTDSLIVNETGKQNLEPWLDDSKLGALKIESEAETGTIWNVKDYVFADEVKIKGVSRKANHLGGNRWEVEQWEHFNGAVHQNRVETVITSKTVKVLTRQYEKGIVGSNGRTQPFIF